MSHTTQPETLPIEQPETWRPDVNRPLTPHDLRRAIDTIMFAVCHEKVQIHASQEPDHKTYFYSLHDAQTAIDVFQKMCKEQHNTFRIKVYEQSEPDSPSFQENPFAENSLYSMISSIRYHASNTDLFMTATAAFVSTLIHGEPWVKKHPRTRSKGMQKSLDRFKIFFEVMDCPDFWYLPFIDLALYARDIMKQNGVKLGKGGAS
ncbi:MAG: hypothetical protein AB7S77_24480 [Desulfatirhabdiaceae bacterium]